MPVKFLGISTQSVGVGPGGGISMLARVSIVNYRGGIELDCWVKPTLPVSDYRTLTTGIEAHNLDSEEAIAFDVVQQHAAIVIMGNILVGHSLWNDLSVLGLSHPTVFMRDIALYRPFESFSRPLNLIMELQLLVWALVVIKIQSDKSNPLENARAAVDLYRSVVAECEEAITAGQWPFVLPPENFSRCYL